MFPDELLIAFGDESYMFLTCQLSVQAHVTNELLHSAFFLCVVGLSFHRS